MEKVRTLVFYRLQLGMSTKRGTTVLKGCYRISTLLEGGFIQFWRTVFGVSICPDAHFLRSAVDATVELVIILFQVIGSIH